VLGEVEYFPVVALEEARNGGLPIGHNCCPEPVEEDPQKKVQLSQKVTPCDDKVESNLVSAS